MRWIKPAEPRVGDTRIKSKFLIFPKTIDGVTVWLEYAYWIERYSECIDIVSGCLCECEWCYMCDCGEEHDEYFYAWIPKTWTTKLQSEIDDK